MEKERTRRIEAAREKEKLLPEASQREEGEKENKAVTPPDSALKKAEQGHCVAEVSEAEKLKNAQRQDELVASVASLREERAMFEGEVARLRSELERRDAEREEKLANADAKRRGRGKRGKQSLLLVRRGGEGRRHAGHARDGGPASAREAG
jgi:hypothetical protein